MKSTRYGHVVKHLEKHHLNGLPGLRLRPEIRAAFEEKAKDIIESRDRAHEMVNQAEDEYQLAIGMVPDTEKGTDGFVTRASEMFARGRRLEGNFTIQLLARRSTRFTKRPFPLTRSGAWWSACLFRGASTMYMEMAGPHNSTVHKYSNVPPMLRSLYCPCTAKGKRGIWWIGERFLIPCSGQLHGIIGSVVLATDWHEDEVLTNHMVRVVLKKNSTIRVGYLQTVLGHRVLGRPRMLKNAHGSSVPELSPMDIADLVVPRLRRETEDRIADAMEEAAQRRRCSSAEAT